MNNAALAFIIGMQPGVAGGLGTLMLIFGVVMLPLALIAGIGSLCGPPYPYDHRRAAAFDAARSKRIEAFVHRHYRACLVGSMMPIVAPGLFFGARLIGRMFLGG